MTDKLLVTKIRAFEGPIHDDLDRIWDAYAEYYQDYMVLRTFANPARWRHSRMLQHIWDTCQAESDNRYLIITESDFLPGPCFLTMPDELSAKYPVATSAYVTRDPFSKVMTVHEEVTGPWYMIFDRKFITGHVPFRDEGGFNDPANLVHLHIKELYGKESLVLMPKDGVRRTPSYYGTRHETGDHLFWSRHYNDLPETVVAGFEVGDIVARTKKRVRAWVSEQPKGYCRILDRLGGLIACQAPRSSVTANL